MTDHIYIVNRDNYYKRTNEECFVLTRDTNRLWSWVKTEPENFVQIQGE